MICVSLTSSDPDKLRADIRKAADVADVIEIRLDYLTVNVDIGHVLANKPKPIIVTCRRVADGGLYDGDDRVRIAALEKAAAQGADFIDIELDAASELRDVPARRIVSYHNFRETPHNLAAIYRRCAETQPDIIKLVAMANSQTDNLRMFELLRNAQQPTAAFCMGELGIISRIIGRKFGSRLTYAALAPGREAAPGQLTANELRTLYRYHQVSPDTAVYGVIANPVAHSMSPAIHNAAFNAAGIDAVYLPFKVDDVGLFVKAFKEIDVQGYSVTIPHKESIMAVLDEIDPVAASIGAVNTVVNRNGRLLGCNTDYMAAVACLEDVTDLPGKSALMIGAGGAARAVAFGLKQKNVNLTVADIAAEKARKLAEDVGCAWSTMENLGTPTADIFINATPAGMHPNVDTTAIPREWLKPNSVVFDVVYNPIETRLLREAREVGCRTVGGFEMFVRQAVAQFEMWTGTQAPVDVMTEVVRGRLTA